MALGVILIGCNCCAMHGSRGRQCGSVDRVQGELYSANVRVHISGRPPRNPPTCGMRAGMVAGLVASAACCAIVPTWAGIIAGACAAIFAQALAHLAPMVGIDDPVNAGTVTVGSLCMCNARKLFCDAYCEQGIFCFLLRK